MPMSDGEFILFVVLSILFGLIALGYNTYRNEQYRRIAMGDGPRLITRRITRTSLKDEAFIDALKDVIVKVCVMRNVAIETKSAAVIGAGVASNTQESVWTSFFIDIHGETYDIESSTNYGEIEQFAQQLAKQLGVPYVDSSYGTH